MRLHVISLPHSQTTREWSRCAYTTKVRRFCDMMNDGNEVILYAGDENEAACKELVTVTPRDWQAQHGFNGPDDYLKIDFDPMGPVYKEFNLRLAQAIPEYYQAGDLICLITGWPHATLAGWLPGKKFVEFGIGYQGVHFPFRVFESYAWMHTVYGHLYSAANADGQITDTVIPNYFDLDDFPYSDEHQGYHLYLGRLTERKGWQFAQQVCEQMGVPFVVAGQGEFTGYGDYRGVVGPQERAELLGGAKAVWTPTCYVEPFCGVHVEAMLCGTPVIATDWGIYTETIVNGVNGFRCRAPLDFLEAIAKIDTIDRRTVSDMARARFSLEVVKAQYERYFRSIL